MSGLHASRTKFSPSCSAARARAQETVSRRVHLLEVSAMPCFRFLEEKSRMTERILRIDRLPKSGRRDTICITARFSY